MFCANEDGQIGVVWHLSNEVHKCVIYAAGITQFCHFQDFMALTETQVVVYASSRIGS